ncbi:hypothetical protein OS493_037190 [Desmophyllum pertusum]|uniref:C-CAP/cofactor C-like domain-containing protein n=1 Tax=Desmophyllum pertusum TaxID=174260 RepID=A0A9X0CPQ5_9CNID|nr:hypothetical protein OS493_037190 [Desmophyllum pertusum]
MKAIEFFDSLSDKCQKLQKFLTDSAMCLPSRDIQVSQDNLKALQQDINEKREEFIPKKKFAFKARKKEASTKGEGQINQEMKNKDALTATEKTLFDASLGFQGVTDQTLTMASSQLRVHSTTDSKFYLHVTSRAIVEDCSRVGFAPFNWEYEALQSDFKSAGLDPLENNWSIVNDFNWLKTDEPSPNWFIISEDQRANKWTL